MELNAADIKKYLAPDATDAEVNNFKRYCESLDLNPWIREVYLVKAPVRPGQTYSSPAQIVVSKDAFLKRATSSPDYDGFSAGVILKTKSGDVIYRNGSFVDDDEKLVGGWAEVLIKGRTTPIRAEVSMKEYAKKKADGSLAGAWAQIPATMIRKVPIVQAHREAYPDLVGNMYSEDEMSMVMDDAQTNYTNMNTLHDGGQTVSRKQEYQAKPVSREAYMVDDTLSIENMETVIPRVSTNIGGQTSVTSGTGQTINRTVNARVDAKKSVVDTKPAAAWEFGEMPPAEPAKKPITVDSNTVTGNSDTVNAKVEKVVDKIKEESIKTAEAVMEKVIEEQSPEDQKEMMRIAEKARPASSKKVLTKTQRACFEHFLKYCAGDMPLLQEVFRKSTGKNSFYDIDDEFATKCIDAINEHMASNIEPSAFSVN